MRTTWLKVWVWIKVWAAALLLIYLLVFVYRNSQQKVTFWVWWNTEPTTSSLLLAVFSFVAGGLKFPGYCEQPFAPSGASEMSCNKLPTSTRAKATRNRRDARAKARLFCSPRCRCLGDQALPPFWNRIRISCHLPKRIRRYLPQALP